MAFKLNRNDVQRVVVILAGSRTGSSFLFNSLRSLGRFAAAVGEETPYLRSVGLGWPLRPGGSDALSGPYDLAQLDQIAESWLSDAGVRTNSIGNRPAWIETMVRRCRWQWPGILTEPIE